MVCGTRMIMIFVSTLAQTVSQDPVVNIPLTYPSVPGSQVDAHNCVLDGGYQWCESAQACQRPWEHPCVPVLDTHSCGTPCPPLPPCPRLSPTSCTVTQPLADECGCTLGCPSIDCKNIALQGEPCGGYMLPEMVAVCDSGLECVYPRGLADAPGRCMPICSNERDQYGNCLQVAQSVPRNCVTWYDGCNTCSANNGQLQGCTLMMCFTQSQPYCQAYSTSIPLQVGDLCYRYCENGSQNSIDMRSRCPAGSKCSSRNPSLVVFDSCGDNALMCIEVSGH